jgi:pectin methylesterase-like acyl-CoA thioesterase
MLGVLFSIVGAFAIGGLALDEGLCQRHANNTLEYCPPGTVLVGKAPDAAFQTIQAAIESLPNDNTTSTILVLAGNYTEQLNVTRHAPITILGQTADPFSQKANLVTVYWASANGAGSGFNDNAYTSVLTVAPNLNASLVGSGPTGFNVPPGTPFGNTNFRAYNINFRNTFAEMTAGPAHAVAVSRANAGFYFCGFYSYQDSVYIGHLGNSYFYESELAGQTDFLYGFGTAWIEKSILTLRGCGGGITAWKGTNTTFANKYGVYIANSAAQAANSSILQNNVGRCSLGRPWNAMHRSIYMNTSMDTTINPQGYTGWGTPTPPDTTFMAEYENFGPGWNVTARIKGNATRVLSDEQVAPYQCASDVFMDEAGSQPYTQWIDSRYLSC